MPIGRDLIGSMTNRNNGWVEKLLGCLPISLLAQQRINQIAIVVDSSREVAPLPAHFQGGFINIPGSSNWTTSLRSQPICSYRQRPDSPPILTARVASRGLQALAAFYLTQWNAAVARTFTPWLILDPQHGRALGLGIKGMFVG